MSMSKAFAAAASGVSWAVGRPITFLICVALVVAWALSGPLFGFSDTWQLIINTSTTVVTFLMVFLIQNTQTRDNAAIQTKLDELIRSGSAENAFVGIEHLSDDELEALRAASERRARAVAGEVEARKSGKANAVASPEATDASAHRRQPRSRRCCPSGPSGHGSRRGREGAFRPSATG